jgi:methionine-rich copper-binding protein CopC
MATPLFTSRTTLRVAAAALTFSAAQLAFAHASPTRQEPSAGSLVSASQRYVAIDFNDELEPAFSSLSVNDANGEAVTASKAVIEPSNKMRMSVALKPLTSGMYTVAWSAVAADGHRTHGDYTFIVGSPRN